MSEENLNEGENTKTDVASAGPVQRVVMRFAFLAMLFYRDFKTGQKYIFR